MADSLDGAFDPSTIVGNVSDDIKRATAASLQSEPTTFGGNILNRLKVTEMSVKEKADEPRKTEARVVFEVDVTEDMLNGANNVHGGCSAYLVDMCSSVALIAFQKFQRVKTGKSEGLFTVSQSLNIIYHAPATLGERLRIISTTLTLGARALTVRAEIWSATNHRLVVSGTHVKMKPVTRSKM